MGSIIGERERGLPDKGIAMLLGEGIHMSGRLLGRGGITRGRITRETLPWIACLDLACSLWLQLELAGAIGREGSCCFVFMSSPSEASQTDVVKQEYPAIPRGEAQKLKAKLNYMAKQGNNQALQNYQDDGCVLGWRCRSVVRLA